MNVQSFQVLVPLTSPLDFSMTKKNNFFPVFFFHFMFGNLNFGVLKLCGAPVSENLWVG